MNDPFLKFLNENIFRSFYGMNVFLTFTLQGRASKRNKCGMIWMKIKFFFILQLFRSSIKLKKTFVTRIELFSIRIIKKWWITFSYDLTLMFIFVSKTVQISVFLQKSKINMTWIAFKRFSHDFRPLFRSILIRK